VVQLAGIFLGSGNAVTLAFYPNDRVLERHPTVSSAGAVHFASRFSSVSGLVENTLSLLRFIRVERPEIIYTNTVFPMLAIALLRMVHLLPAQTRIVHTLHSFFFDKFRSRPGRAVACAIERLMSRAIDRAIAPSEYMRQIATKIYVPSRITLIRNSLSARLEADLVSVRAARVGRVSRAACKLLFVGRADRQKGLDLLLKAVQVLRSTQSVHVTLGGVTREECLELCNALHLESVGIECLGWVDDTASLYKDADIFVMPSRWEAFGLTLLEARMAGVVCVGSDVDAIPELISPNCGVTVTKDSVTALVEGIRDVMARLPILDSACTSDDLPTYAKHERAQLELLAKLRGKDESDAQRVRGMK